jgi:ubiquinone biosynthesis protein UbiJ
VFSPLDIANRALEQERWARDKLAIHAGRVVRVDIGPARESFAVAAEGRLDETQAAPDLQLSISPLRLPALLAQPERWDELVVAEGDAALAATLSELALTLPWFVEAVFAKAFGPVAGQKIADIGRRLLALPDYAARRFGESLTSYIGDEAQLATGAAEARVVASEIATLAARVDTLALRIAALGEAAAAAAAGPAPAKGAPRSRRGSPR